MARREEIVTRSVLWTAALALGCGASSSGRPPPFPPANLACAGVFCGASPPEITLHVVDAVTSSAIQGVAITNVVRPPPTTGEAFPTDAFCSEGIAPPAYTSCDVYGPGPGTYELDLGAPGYQTRHLVIDVPASDTPPDACCGLSYVPRTIDVTLTRA
jgi:hypothetical protein